MLIFSNIQVCWWGHNPQVWESLPLYYYNNYTCFYSKWYYPKKNNANISFTVDLNARLSLAITFTYRWNTAAMIFCFWQNCCYGDKEYNTRIWVEHQGLGKVWLGLVCWQSAYSEKMGSIPALALRKQLKKQPWWHLLPFPWALWGSTLGQETIVPSRDERFCWRLGWRLSQAE